MTAHDVARRAGVSQSAVSRAFTPGASVAPDKAAHIRAVAEALGYRPNLIARSLINGRSNIVGLAVGRLDNPFYAAMLNAISERLTQAGLRVLLFTDGGADAPDPPLSEVLLYNVAGLILAATNLSSHLAQECHQAGIPVVLLNRTTSEASASCVRGDNEGGARRIAEFLADGGHRRFAYLAGLDDSSTSRERESAFQTRLAELGLPPAAREPGHYDFAAACAATRRLLSAADAPDAIFCANDHMAFAAIEVARSEFGRTIGRDLSVIGFDDVAMAAWPSFQLTTYSQPVAQMASRAVALVLPAEDLAPARETIAGELVVRASARITKA